MVWIQGHPPGGGGPAGGGGGGPTGGGGGGAGQSPQSAEQVEQDSPGLQVPFPQLGGGVVTVKVKGVVLVRLPAVPVTVMVEEPIVAVDEAAILRVLLQVGLQIVGEKE